MARKFESRTFNFADRPLRALPVPDRPPKEKRQLGLVDYFDSKERGLSLRVSYAGTKTFVVSAKNQTGKRRKKTLGRFGTGSGYMSLADARSAARAFKGEYAAGRDVVAEIRNEKVERGEAPNLGQIIERYLAEHLSTLKPATQRQYTAILIGSKRHREEGGHPTIMEVFGDQKFRDIRRKAVVEYLDAIAARGAKYLANRTHEVFNHLLKWAIRKSVDESVEHSVADLWERHAEPPRERWLNDGDISKLWGILDETVSANNALIYRLLLTTGQRESEILTLRWDELDFSKGEWIIPAEKTKSGRTQLVPMTCLFRQLLTNRAQESEWVFPSPGYRNRYSKSGHLTRNSLANVHNSVVAAAGIDHFRYHDLRRTMATHLGELGFDEFIVSRILNHSPSGVTGRHYNFHGYKHEKQQALEAWGYKLCWLMGHGPKPELVRQFFEWGFDKRWKNSPWNLEQWLVDSDNIVTLSPPARHGA